MARTAAGDWIPLAPVVGGTIITSTWANSMMTSFGADITQSLDRSGRGGMLVPFRIADGSEDEPGYSWTAEISTGFYRDLGGFDMRVSIGGQDNFRWNASGAQLWNQTAERWDSLNAIGGATTIEVEQTAHGFTLLQAIYWDGAEYVLAQADVDTTMALGVITEVIDVDNFTFAMSGRFEINNPLTGNEWYYLDDAVAGGLTVTEPKLSQPIVYSEVAGSSGSVIVYPYRPFEADPFADLPTVGTENQILRWQDSLPGWEATSNFLVFEDGTISAGNLGGLVVTAGAPVNTMVLDAGGNVGIGTASPSVNLQISGASSSFARITSVTSADIAGLDLGFAIDPDNCRMRYVNGVLGIEVDKDDSLVNSAIFFGVDNDEKMRIDDLGNVGVGISDFTTNSPTDKFAVLGDIGVGNTDVTNGGLMPFGLQISSNGTDGLSTVPLVKIGAYRDAFDRGEMILSTVRTGPVLTEAMRIDADGIVLIGLQSGVVDHGRLQVTYTSTNAARHAAVFSVGAPGQSTGNKIIGFQTGNTVAQGSIASDGADAVSFSTFSDLRMKENITPLEGQLANILALNPVEFDFKSGSGHQTGFIAQEMIEVYPDSVDLPEDPEAMMSIGGWSKTDARLVKAIQELTAQVQALSSEVEALKNV